MRTSQLHRLGLIASLAIFSGGLLWAAAAMPPIHDIKFAPLIAIVVVGMPLQLALNTEEFRLLARYAGQQIDWVPALTVTTYSSAANMLPLPGGVLTRIAAMKSYGIPTKKGAGLNIIGSLLWGAVAFIYAGGWLMAGGQMLIGGGFLTSGFVAMLAASTILWRTSPHAGLLAATFLVRLSGLVLEAARMLLAVAVVGVAADFSQVSAFVIASFLGAATAITPSGLGVREAVVALIAPLVGIDPEVGFLAASINRIAGMAGLALAAGTMSILVKRGYRAAG